MLRAHMRWRGSRRTKRLRKKAGRTALLIGGGLLFGLLCVNACVRSRGGDVALLEPRRASERGEALSRLGWHWLASWADLSCEDAAQAARRAARLNGLSAELVLAVMHVESDFVHTRISGTGAMGLMQLMPGTARELSVRDPFDPDQNAEAGARYLKTLLASYRGQIKPALAAYNAGQGNVPSRDLRGVPRETLAYVARVLQAKGRF